MIEYALLIAGNGFGTIASTVNAYFYRIDWAVVSYVLLALVVLRIAYWALTKPR
jgi:hypothetical protein